MKDFEFNEHGVCVNPNIIFRSTSNGKSQDYSSNHYFSIFTAETGGQWIYGIDYSIGNSGGGYGPSKNFGGTFPTEKDAIRAAAEDVKERVREEARWRNADEPSPPEAKLIRLADGIIHPRPVELSLF